MTDAAQLPPATAASTPRVRRHRERQRDGLALWRVVVPEVLIETLLVSRGFVDRNCEDRATFEKALSAFIASLVDDETRFDEFLTDYVESET